MSRENLIEEKHVQVIAIHNNDNNNSKDDYNITYSVIEREQLFDPMLFAITPATDLTEFDISFGCPVLHEQFLNSRVNILASYIADNVMGGTIIVIPKNANEIPQILNKLKSILMSMNFDSAKESLEYAIQKMYRQRLESGNEETGF